MSCGGSSDSSDNGMVNDGSWYVTRFKWPHDGNPLKSENFVIYSDAASPEARQLLSEVCEETFATIKERFGITDVSIFRFPEDRNNKIHIYAYKNYFPRKWGGQAYYGGYLIYSPDHPERTEEGSTALDQYIPVIQHELMHVIQTLILGALDESLLYSWFAEGIAIEISDNTFYENIDSQQQLDDLTSTFGTLNPISLQYSWTYPDIENVIAFYYYPMFWLSVKYLMDPDGQGGSFYDVRDVLIDVANGVQFSTSLRNRFGMSVTEYEEQFFDLMNDYLQ
jgi:hypothetical protein